MDYFSIALQYCLDGISAVFSWFGIMIAACGPTAYAVILALFIFAAAFSLIIIPLRGQAISDMASNQYTSSVKSKGKYSSGRMKWFGKSKGIYSK